MSVRGFSRQGISAHRSGVGCCVPHLATALALSTCLAARADLIKLGIDADLGDALGIGPGGIPAFAGGETIPIEVYAVIYDTEGDGYDSQGLAGAVWNLASDTGIMQNQFRPAATYDDKRARVNNEVWLDTAGRAYFVGGFGFQMYDGGNTQSPGDVAGAGIFMGLLWHADVSDADGLQPFALNGVGFGSPPGTDVGGRQVGDRRLWYLMKSAINVPLDEGVYHVLVGPSSVLLIRPDVNLSADVPGGYLFLADQKEGDSFVFHVGGTDPQGSPPTPVVRAQPTFGESPLAVRFDATDSSDPDGQIVAYEWEFGDGSALAAGAVVTHTFERGGYFTTRLRVTDDDRLSAVAEQVISVDRNVAPVAVAQADVLRGAAPLTVHFDGSGCSDPDGGALAYLWEFGDGGPPAFSVSIAHTFADYGTYVVTLTVRDPEGAVGSDSVMIRVENQPPNATFDMEPEAGQVPLTIVFNASGSTDPDGDAMSFNWDFGDGQGGTGASTAHTYLTPGLYSVELTVTDQTGLYRTVGRSVRVLLPDGRVSVPVQGNKPPTIGLSASPGHGPAPLTVTFGFSSSDPDGDPVSFTLDTGAGEHLGDLAAGGPATYTYRDAGEFVAQATAFDGRGGVARAKTLVTVLAVEGSAIEAAVAPAPRRGLCGTGIAEAAGLGFIGLFAVAGLRVQRRR